MFLAAALTIPAAVPVVASESTADKEETFRKDGIEKLVNTINDDAKDILDRADAVMDEGLSVFLASLFR
jgi:hypothetical protein